MKGNPIRWFEIYVQDMEQAKRFYESVFEVKLEKLNNPLTLATPSLELWSFPSDMNASGCSGALVKMDGVPSGGASVIVYFASDDCAVEEKRVLKARGQIVRSKTSLGEYGFITLATDTEGNVFGIHSLK